MKTSKRSELIGRGLVGFFASFVISCFALSFLGMLPPGNDLSVPEMEEQTRSLWIAFGLGCGVGVMAVACARVRVSEFWLWFAVVFGVTSLVPFWPHKDGSVLPFATPYVNASRLHMELVWMLMAHIAVAAAVAGVFYWVSLRLQRRQSAS